MNLVLTNINYTTSVLINKYLSHLIKDNNVYEHESIGRDTALGHLQCIFCISVYLIDYIAQ